MKPLSILYTIPNFDTAGSGQVLLNIVARLDRRRFAPSVCVLRRGGGRMEDELERLGVPLLESHFTVEARPLVTLPSRARQAAAAFRGRGFALWHSYHYLDDYTEPLVARFAGARAWIYTKKSMSWNRRSWYVRSLLATRIAAMNTDMIRGFFDGPMLRKRSVLLPPGVDAEHFRPDVSRRLDLRRRFGVPPGDVVVGCVAQLLPVKGHQTLIRAVAAVPGVRLWLAGRELDPEHAAALRQEVREANLEGRVEFLGEIRDVPALLAELDIFALPTWDEGRMEGCPVALLEAMASGRACVATDIPGSRDIVVPGESGMLVPPRDAAAMADALLRLSGAARLRRDLGAAARARMLEAYSIEKETRAYEDLYAEALGLPEVMAA